MSLFCYQFNVNLTVCKILIYNRQKMDIFIAISKAQPKITKNGIV